MAGASSGSRWRFGRVSKTQDRLSLDALLVPVDVVVPAGGAPDPGDDVVQFQFVAGGQPPRARPTAEANPPLTTGWLDGGWETTDAGVLYASILVGPEGEADLPGPQDYAAWVRVEDDPTTPVVLVGTLRIR